MIGICNGVVMLGAAGALRGRRVTASLSALATLADLDVAEIVPAGAGVVVDGNLYTAGPGIGSFEVALRVAAAEFGVQAGEMAELLIEYDPHPPFGDRHGPGGVARAGGAVRGADGGRCHPVFATPQRALWRRPHNGRCACQAACNRGWQWEPRLSFPSLHGRQRAHVD